MGYEESQFDSLASIWKVNHFPHPRDRSSLEPVNSLLRAGAPGPQAGRFRRDDRQLDEVSTKTI